MLGWEAAALSPPSQSFDLCRGICNGILLSMNFQFSLFYSLQGCVGVIVEVCQRASGLPSDSNPQQPSSQAATPSQPATPHQPFSHPTTPLMPFQPSLALASPGVSATAIGSEGSALLEQFEAAQEAEDRLAQLLMDEELSDARLAGEEDEKHLKLQSELTYLNSEPTLKCMDQSANVEESKESGFASSKEWEVQNETGGSGSEDRGSMVTSYQPTHDPQETERLEQARTVARCECILGQSVY